MHRQRLTGLVVALVTGALAVLALPGTANAGPNEGDLFSAVNSARASAGLPGYAYAGDLASVARAQAERMAASGELYHNPNLGSDVSGWSRIAENVAYAGDWRSAHQVLMNSAPHRAAILDSGYTQMGVGTAVDSDGTLWVAEVFRTPSGASSSPSPSSTGTSGGTSSTPATTTTTTATSTTPAPAPSPEQVLRQQLREAREKVQERQKGRHSNDPITSALDFSAVMETVSR